MSERYTRLCVLPENLYAAGSPVLLSAGALLKDNQTGRILVQLKLRSLSPMNIKAVKVSVCPFDTVGAPLGEAVEHQYLDLTAARGDEFGAKLPIVLPDAATRAFSAVVTEVAFADNRVWHASGAPWEQLLVPQPLEQALDDAELVKQFRMTCGEDCKCLPVEYKDLRYCACGARNRREEAVCHRCGREHATLAAIDLNALRAARDARLAEEAEQAEAARIAAAAQAKKTKKITLITVTTIALIAAAVLLTTKVIIPAVKYNAAVDLMEAGQYTDAIAAFEAMDGYKDSAEQITECKYLAAVALLDAEQYSKACATFEELGAYKDSAEQIKECLRLALKNPQVGDYVLFGTYEQDNDTANGKEEIEWLVLDVQDGKALLISKYALDCKPYNRSESNVTWETCTLRTWLNEDFLNAAFSAEEQSVIHTVTVSADKNPKYKTNPGNATQDKVFLLSIVEADKYFASSSARACKPTKYAVANGSNVSNYYGNCWWWLRSPGVYQSRAAYGHSDGGVNGNGYFVNSDDGAVRPAIWVELGK